MVFNVAADTSPMVVLAVAVALALGMTIAWAFDTIDRKPEP